MKLNDAGELNNWVIELRDGCLQVQRHFHFNDQAVLDGFIHSIGECLSSPSLCVTVTQKSISPATLVVRITLVPERVFLEAAGGIARVCELEYAQLNDAADELAA